MRSTASVRFALTSRSAKSARRFRPAAAPRDPVAHLEWSEDAEVHRPCRDRTTIWTPVYLRRPA